jgi:hypothetical protein
VTVSHAVSPAPLPLQFKDEVFYRDRISTAARSLARLLLGTKALVTVRELSELQLIDQAGTSTIQLALGKIAIGVLRQRMRPGETVEIRTQNAVAAIRGTVVVAETLTPPGASDPVTRLHVLSGYIDVTTPGNPGAPPLRLVAPSSVTVTGHSMDHPVPLDAAARAALLSDLQPTQPLPTKVLEDLVLGEQARAAGLARIITGEGSGGDERPDVQGPHADGQEPNAPSGGPSSPLPFIFNNRSPNVTGDLQPVRSGTPPKNLHGLPGGDEQHGHRRGHPAQGVGRHEQHDRRALHEPQRLHIRHAGPDVSAERHALTNGQASRRGQ